jgi:hypothetical protein
MVAKMMIPMNKKTIFNFVLEAKEYLFEKTHSFDIKPSTSDTNKLIKKLNNFKHANYLGGGVEALAYFNKNTQTVIKVIKFKNSLTEQDVKEESTYLYLKEITKEFNSSNPHFPRIYSIKFFISEDGNIYGVVTMERLYSVKDFDDSIIEAAIRNAGINPVMGDPINDFLANIDSYLIGVISNNFIKKLHGINPQFAKALIIVRKLINKYKFYTDLHAGNVMIRLTSVGPQIVLTDPLAPDWLR